MCECMVRKYTTMLRKKVTVAMVMPRAGCLRPPQGAFSHATTQLGESQEAMAANIMMASAAYSRA